MNSLGWTVKYYLPNRKEEGYGLSQHGIDNCIRKHNPTLLLAMDCGSTSAVVIDGLGQKGVDVIVLDHHQISNPSPKALALVNPHNLSHPSSSESKSPYSDLCSAGLAFKLVHALIKRGRNLGMAGWEQYDLKPLLDLVALGTIADLVTLTGENRILVSAGLKCLNTTTRPGLIALREVAGIKTRMTGYEVGFLLGPRLNAAGRMETAGEALRLLLTKDQTEANQLATELDARNKERQQIERSIAEKAIEQIRKRFNPENDYVIVEGDTTWHIGVVGIVASRVMHEFHRPTIILGGEHQEWRGSGRSIDGFDLAGALHGCTDLLVRHGGHAMAAGVSIQPEKVDDFRSRLNSIARKSLKPDQLFPVLRLDAEVRLSDINIDCVRELERLQQTGIGNPPVNVVLRGVTHQRPLQRIGSDRRHAKMWITDGRGTHEALLWNVGEGNLPVGRFDMAVSPQLHEYNGSTWVQLKVLDWQEPVR